MRCVLSFEPKWLQKSHPEPEFLWFLPSPHSHEPRATSHEPRATATATATATARATAGEPNRPDQMASGTPNSSRASRRANSPSHSHSHSHEPRATATATQRQPQPRLFLFCCPILNNCSVNLVSSNVGGLTVKTARHSFAANASFASEDVVVV